MTFAISKPGRFMQDAPAAETHWARWAGGSPSMPDAEALDVERWLQNTPALQFDHPALRIQVQKLTQLRSGSQAKAMACFEFLRAMPFKYVADPARVAAPEVLRMASGDSYTKGLLFVAMLRALRVPARLRIVTLPPDILHGLLDTHGEYVPHAISEVLLRGTWMRLDAYCIDVPLALGARARLLREGRRTGYGVHMKGQVRWDGCGDALSQFCIDDPRSLPTGDMGVHADASSLADDLFAPGRGWAGRGRSRLRAALINRRIEALRCSLRLGQARGGYPAAGQ